MANKSSTVKTTATISTALALGIIIVVAIGAAVLIGLNYFAGALPAAALKREPVKVFKTVKKCEAIEDFFGKKIYQNCEINSSQLRGKSSALKSKLQSLPKERQAELNYELQKTRDAVKAKGDTWKADWNLKMVLSDDEKKNLNGLIGRPPVRSKSAPKSAGGAEATVSLPDFFDWRDANGQNYITSVKDQGNCGSCWAFGADATFEGHIQAYYNNPGLFPDLAEQDLVSCAVPFNSYYNSGGCSGTNSDQIESIFSNYWIKIGNALETCIPYTGTDAACGKCADWDVNAWKDSNYRRIYLTDNVFDNINSIKQAVIENGPVEVGYLIYNDFFAYSSGIYRHATDIGPCGGGPCGHAVTIVGFGKSDGMDYWIVKNSWGSDWGENGYFKIFADDSEISSWFALAVNGPIPPSSQPQSVSCTDNDSDGYCYWGLGGKPTATSTCAASCLEQIEKDCDDSNGSIFQGCGQSNEQLGALAVSANISEADVYVKDLISGNFVFRGKTPLTTNLNTGERVIRVGKAEYMDVSRTETIEAGQTKTINVTLMAQPKIIRPMNNDIYKAGKAIDLVGTIPAGFKNFAVQWAPAGAGEYRSDNIILTNGGVGQVTDSVIATWDSSGQPTGYYSILFWATTDAGETFTKSILNIYLDSTLKDGWPVYLQEDEYVIDVKNNLNIFNYYADQPFLNGLEAKNTGKISTVLLKNSNEANTGFNTSYQRYFALGLLEPLVSDLNNDGNKEIIVLKGGMPPKIYVYNPDGSLLWFKNVGLEADEQSHVSIPLIGDLDNDGLMEIIVFIFKSPDSNPTNSELYSFNHDGSLSWKIPMPKDYRPTMLMADLDNDGNKEIVIKGNGGVPAGNKMVIVSNQGAIIKLWDLWITHGGSDIFSSPAVGNFDDDRDLEIVVAAGSENAGPVYEGGNYVNFINEGLIYVYNRDGSIVSGWPQYVPGDMPSTPVVGDINNDQLNEIILGLIYSSDFCSFPCQEYGGLYAFDKNGNVLPGWPVLKGYNFKSTPSLGDINKDGKLEIAISKIGYETYLFDYLGRMLPGWPQYKCWSDYYGSVMGDIDGDNNLEVVTTAGGIYSGCGVYAWNTDGSSLSGFPKVTEVDAQAPAVIDDIDNDGKVEIIATADLDTDLITYWPKYRGSIYVWDLDGFYNEQKMPWPTYQHDSQHTGLYFARSVDLQIKNVTSVGTPAAPALSFNLCMNGPTSLADIGLGAFTFETYTYNSARQKSQKSAVSIGGSAIQNMKNGECVLYKKFIIPANQIAEFNTNKKITLNIDPGNSILETDKANNVITFDASKTCADPFESANTVDLPDYVKPLNPKWFDPFIRSTTTVRSSSSISQYNDQCLIDVKSATNVWKSTRVDSCSAADEDNVTKRNCRLQEAYCAGTSLGNYSYKCPNGCLNGACLGNVPTVSSVLIADCAPDGCTWQAGTFRDITWKFSNFSSGIKSADAVNTVILNFCNPVTKACTVSVNAGVELNTVWAGYDSGQASFNLGIGAKILTNPALAPYINDSQAVIKVCPTDSTGQVASDGICFLSPVFTITTSTSY